MNGGIRPAERAVQTASLPRSAYVGASLLLLAGGWLWGAVVGWEPTPICRSGLDECDGAAQIFEEVARFATPLISIAVFFVAFMVRPSAVVRRALWAALVAVSLGLVYRSIGGLAEGIVVVGSFAVLMIPRVARFS